MFKAFFKLLVDFIQGTLIRIANFIWLLLPLGFHVFLVQMRERIDTLPAITTYYSEDSTWTTVYDGVVIVNTNPGALRRRFRAWQAWFASKTYLWIALAILTVLILLSVVSVHILNIGG